MDAKEFFFFLNFQNAKGCSCAQLCWYFRWLHAASHRSCCATLHQSQNHVLLVPVFSGSIDTAGSVTHNVLWGVFFFFFFKFSCLFHELSVTGAFSTSVLGWAWPYYSNLQFDAWNLIWCVFGVFCTCLSFQAETASDLMGVTIFQWLCTEFTNNKEGPLHNGWFQFQLSLLQANYELSWSVLFTRMPTFSSCHDPLVRPPPAPLISPISI